MKILVTFIILSIINVIFSTIRSITTIKSSKTIASFISGGYFAFYNIMLIYTVANFPMWQKCLITFICNVVGVWIVKFCEEQMKKDKLWLVKITVPKNNFNSTLISLNKNNISFSYNDITKYIVFDCYCNTQNETKNVIEICKNNNGKMFATENKLC